ncbi:MAG: glycosyl hydrolase family 8, partial [Pseudomonadota bacterium]
MKSLERLAHALLACWMIAACSGKTSDAAERSAAPTAPASVGAATLETAEAQFLESWAAYKRKFLESDGRIIDTNEGSPSHTEGQGSAMLFAVTADDRATFDQLWRWTQRNLQQPHGLFAWRYLPDARPNVADKNNATDGDLMIAWALLRAAEQWDEKDYRTSASLIVRGMERRLVRRLGERAVLLPGAYAFEKEGGAIVNLSYFLFPAYERAKSVGDAELWAELYEDAAALVAEARLGDHDLPSAWMFVTNEGALVPGPGPNYLPRFGYDAIRIPVYAAWGGLEAQADLARFETFWAGFPDAGAPDHVDLVTGRI